jgi:hypothetical protein
MRRGWGHRGRGGQWRGHDLALARISGEEGAHNSGSGEGERGGAKHAVREWEVGAGSGARASASSIAGGGTMGVWTPSLHSYRVVKITFTGNQPIAWLVLCSASVCEDAHQPSNPGSLSLRLCVSTFQKGSVSPLLGNSGGCLLIMFLC